MFNFLDDIGPTRINEPVNVTNGINVTLVIVIVAIVVVAACTTLIIINSKRKNK